MARGFGTTKGSATTDKIQFVTYAAINSLATISWSIWANRNGGASNDRLWEKGSAIAYYATGASLYRFDHFGWTTPGNWSWADSPGTGAWYHLVITYDTGSTSNDPIVYINGSSVTVTRVLGPTGTFTPDTFDGFIGNRTTGDRGFDGMLAEHAIFDRILTAGEAVALWRGYSPILMNPRAYLPLVRTVQNLYATTTVTTTGMAVQPHPRVLGPVGQSFVWTPNLPALMPQGVF